MRIKTTQIALVACLFTANLMASNVLTFTSSKDNTIIESTDGSKANSINLIYVGNIASSPSIRRGLVAFDLSTLPSDITLDSVKLVLTLSSSTTNTLEVHKVTSTWGEGTANATGGAGVAASSNDVTWLYSVYNSTSWTTAGGDFESQVASSSSIVAGATSVTFRGSALLSHVQSWISNSSTNYGWLLKSNDESIASGKIEKIYSKETGADGQKPTLYVYYSPTTGLQPTTSESGIQIVTTRNELCVKTDDQLIQLELIDIAGRKILTSANKQLNTSAVPSGAYIVKISTSKATQTKKIIIK